MDDITTTTTTTTVNPDVYRFSGFRYQMQAPSLSGFNTIVPQESGFYAFPNNDPVDLNDRGK